MRTNLPISLTPPKKLRELGVAGASVENSSTEGISSYIGNIGSSFRDLSEVSFGCEDSSVVSGDEVGDLNVST